MIASNVYVAESGERGRGVFAGESFAKGALVMSDPVLVVDPEEVPENTALESYLIHWDDKLDAIAFGPTSLLNHSDDPNVACESDFARREIRVVAIRDIAAHEELTFRYRCGVWFETK